MALDPQLEALLDQLDAMDQPPLYDLPVPAARDVVALLATLDGDPEPVSDITDRSVPAPAGDVPVRIYRPVADIGLPVLVWCHAGGGVVGDLDTGDRTCRKLANRTGAIVVSVDYRRAPEHRFPAAVDDCWAATRWVAAHADQIGGDPPRIAVGGDSMGGTFAAVVARRAARRGGPTLRHQLLVYPMTDLTFSHPSVDQYADGYILTKALCRWFADTYLGPDGDPRDPDASPLHAGDVTGCAPATIVIAEHDPIRDDAVAYGKRLSDAGVPVTIHHYDGVTHVFFAFGGVVNKANEAMDRAAGALRAALIG